MIYLPLMVLPSKLAGGPLGEPRHLSECVNGTLKSLGGRLCLFTWLISEVCRMRFLLTIAFLISTAVSATWAVDFRWTSSFAQGTLEAIIRNGNDSEFNIFCPLGQVDTTPGMFVRVTGVQPLARRR